MKNVAEHDRPRERLERSGATALADHELLAILIGHGSGGSSALASASNVLTVANGVHGLPRLRRAHLERVAGIGPAQASRIIAAVELGRRTLTTPASERPQFRTAAETAAYLLPRYGTHPVERFGVMLLDTRYRLMGVRLLSEGSVDSSLAHPRELLREALLASAPAAIAFHNHPSGDPEPSADDIAVTRRLRMAGQVVGVAVVDHVILADARFCSLRERGFV